MGALKIYHTLDSAAFLYLFDLETDLNWKNVGTSSSYTQTDVVAERNACCFFICTICVCDY